MAEPKYAVKVDGVGLCGPFDTMTEATIAGIMSGIPFDAWEAVPVNLVGWLPETRVTFDGLELVFLGRPGPLLDAAIERELARMRPVDPRD